MIDPHDDAADRIAKALSVVPGGLDTEFAAEFVRSYYAEVAAVDLEARSGRDLSSAALAHLHLGLQRPSGTAIVSIFNPEPDELTHRTRHTVIDIVTDDRPYLVDSLSIILARHGIGIHFSVHPLEVIRRDQTGTIVAIGGGGATEAWIHVEVDRQSGSSRCDALRSEIISAIRDTDAVDEDGPAMCVLALDLAATIRREAPTAAERDTTEAAELLEWLADGNFLFLGFREYRVLGEGDDQALQASEGTGLGLLREGLRPPKGHRFSDMPPDMRQRFEEPDPFVFTKDASRSTIVRGDYFEYIGVKIFGTRGEVIGERRFLGFFAAKVYRQSVFDIPILAAKADAVIDASGFSIASHTGRELVDTIEAFPRDELFQITVPELERIARGITSLQERKQVRLFARRDRFGRFMSCLVYVPRDRFSTTVANRIVEVLCDAYGGTSTEHDSRVTDRILARVHVLVRLADDAPTDVDDGPVERRLATLARWWIDDVRDELVATVGEESGLAQLTLAVDAFPAAYRESYGPDVAVADLERMAELSTEHPLATTLVHQLGSPSHEWRLKIYSLDGALALSSIVPLLENLGLRVVDEHPYALRLERQVWLHDIGIELPVGSSLDDVSRRTELQVAFGALWRGDVENDGFNKLVLSAGLTTRQVVVLRSYAKYLRQVGIPFTPNYVETTLNNHAAICRSLISFFEAKFDPASAVSVTLVANVEAEIADALDSVASLDEDRILRALLSVIVATTRTNAYRAVEAPAVPCSAALSFKLDPSKVPDLPLPRPKFEIWVYSPRVEGIHLRGGAIARGGLRWSDRREDFRTEVLGLMKAQMVKNAVIVPVGAKGGFVVKQLPVDPSQRKAEVVTSYETYVAALLDVTDNLVDGKVVAPAGVVRHDGDDPYLVVAADKGTATFSDSANGVAERYGYWLGDAFASGGSVGYDHKAMAITARGAWESVRQHMLMLGRDCDLDAMTVVGIGDMSGDVFGNGMLLSRHLQMVAAFDHRHVFIDPTPNAATSFEERQRLFSLPGSSWDDYDRSLISFGGGVWPRSAKSITLSDAARSVLGVDRVTLAPDELISAILRAPVDLLWNGGIGTYVKASSESNSDVGDRTNDGLRINAGDLRCRVVGEGGNLGFTQRARIEFALGGGYINTDAIDNSAGVDCSDHEVNIKIALDAVVRAGTLTFEERNAVLASMTGEVAELVLEDNRAQNLALAIARVQASPMADVHARQIRSLELAGQIDRQLEFLPDEMQLAERHASGRGLTTPEFAVLLAYTKETTTAALLGTDLPDDPYVEGWLFGYFPSAMREQFRWAIASHPLRREIIATRIVNDMVNHAGLSFEVRMSEETSASATDTTRAHVVARDVFDLATPWAAIDALDGRVDPEHRLELFLALRRLVERGVLWLLRHRRSPIAIASTVDAFRPGVAALAESFPDHLVGTLAEAVSVSSQRHLDAGVPADIARRAATWPYLHTALDIVELASADGCAPDVAGRTYWTLFDRLDLHWVWEQIALLPRTDRSQTQARAAMRDDLLAELRTITAASLQHRGGLDGWLIDNETALHRANIRFAELRTQGVFDLAALLVALRQVRNLALFSAG